MLVREAARVLNISEDAVRMRVKRGTLRADKQGRRLYVLLTPDLTTEPTATRTDELITELRDRVRSLEDQLGAERDANRENRRIIAALTSRIPEIEAPPETRESPVTPTEGEERGTIAPEPERAAGRRSWWSRMFGGSIHG